ncbi:MAG: redoxin family protein [Phycisphaerae bacterium]|jgi:thiol-disulfide isomerase/thioredoxin
MLKRCVAMVCLLGVLGLAPNAFAGDTAIPDDWFFGGRERSTELKAIEGKPAPAINIDTWIGDEVNLAKNRGKVIIVDFWATWCGPCMAAIPKNVALVNKYKDKGLVFVGVHDSSSGWEDAASVVSKNNINYPVGKDKSSAKGGLSVEQYQVQFWPTYVAIDRKGIVRAAGLLPHHVEDVVKLLLAEEGPSEAEVARSWGPEVYMGGAKRPESLRAMEGKPMPRITGETWLGTQPTSWQNQVVVVHFTAPQSPVAQPQLEALVKTQSAFTDRGVIFVTICDANATWDSMTTLAKAAKATMPVVHDVRADGVKPIEPAAAEPASKDAANAAADPAAPQPALAKPAAPAEKPAFVLQPTGEHAKAWGARFTPATFVIDRAGIVRAAGVKADKLQEVVESLLSER